MWINNNEIDFFLLCYVNDIILKWLFQNQILFVKAFAHSTQPRYNALRHVRELPEEYIHFSRIPNLLLTRRRISRETL